MRAIAHDHRARWHAGMLCGAGLFSGLTLGLLGLDLTGLEIIINANPDSIDAKNAKVLKKGASHVLPCGSCVASCALWRAA